jgi:hypothetical protein
LKRGIATSKRPGVVAPDRASPIKEEAMDINAFTTKKGAELNFGTGTARWVAWEDWSGSIVRQLSPAVINEPYGYHRDDRTNIVIVEKRDDTTALPERVCSVNLLCWPYYRDGFEIPNVEARL